ncbi:Single-stranded nucleic acid binding protein, putative (Rna-binding protein, putative) [Candida maltosa Xu316]|uniref:Single-stranded nucleic acid binding protein, putative (Rna-binding protein, putative) n=1 Tax=Candida maltosa (strain Xu316) TaxID=1245528 RepID=M3K3A8_CANMX|nr:Single-stranded nucleic acid binding protein, putative (Rna-binding protein, putative) [Candida maltosa Xu316]
MTSNSSKRYRIYIKNLNYSTTEQDLEELFKNYQRSGRHKPLGIAYAEFRSMDHLEAVVNEFDGVVLHNRKLTVKKHIAYNPNSRRFSFKGKSDSKVEITNGSTGTDGVDPRTSSTGSGTIHPIIIPIVDSPGVISDNKRKLSSNTELSANTILIPKAHGKITDASVREFFKEYNPGKIYIFRSRKPKLNPINLTGNYVSVLATVDASETKLEEIIKKLKAQKLNGKFVTMKPAYKSKVEEVEKAATKSNSLEVIEGSSGGGDAIKGKVVQAEEEEDGKENNDEQQQYNGQEQQHVDMVARTITN